MKGNIIIMKPHGKVNTVFIFQVFVHKEKSQEKAEKKKDCYFNIKRKFHKTCSEKQGVSLMVHPLSFALVQDSCINLIEKNNVQEQAMIISLDIKEIKKVWKLAQRILLIFTASRCN